MTIAIPTIHLNGTSRDALMDAYGNAIQSLIEASEKLGATCPNGRDYYPQGDKAIHVAIAQHEARMQKLNDVIKELNEIGEAL